MRSTWCVVMLIGFVLSANVKTYAAGDTLGPVIGVEAAFEVPAMSVPPLMQWVRDPTFGTKLMRITDVISVSNSGAVVPMYSKTQPWNADGLLLLTYKQGGIHQLRDGRTYEFIRNLGWEHEKNTYPPADIESLWWHPTDPDILIYPCTDKRTETPRMIRYRVSDGTVESICTFPEYKKDWGFGAMAEGNMSSDARWVALRGTRRADKVREYFVYDMQEKRKHAARTLPYKLIDWISISPLGNYVVVNAVTEGVHVYDRDMNLLNSSPEKGEHADLGVDMDGNEVFVSFTFKSIKERLYMMRLSDGHKTTLSGTIDAYDKVYWTGTHVSCRNTRLPGWAYLCTVVGKGKGKPLHKEVYRVRLDGSRHIERLAHHRSDNRVGGYWAEPHLAVNQNGTRMIFASNWSEGAAVATYVLDIEDFVDTPMRRRD